MPEVKKVKMVRDGTLFIEDFVGDEYDAPAVHICCITELVYSEEFPRNINSIREVLFNGSPDTREVAEKLVKLWNESR